MIYRQYQPNRRQLLIGAIGAVAGVFYSDAFAREVLKEIGELRPGEFTWHPERQRTGPVAVVVSLTEQLVHVYRNGIRIAVSTCSSGKPGHATPTGVFVVLQKDKHHRSSTYNDAPMPNMNRLTWSGIALHAGNLPGYPASHGCVRLPLEFSERLFDITHLGTPVIIAGAHSDPEELIHPGMVLGARAEHEFDGVVASLEGKSKPHDWIDLATNPITSVIASSSDRRIMLVENSEVVAETSLIIDGQGPLGNHVYILQQSNEAAKGMQWIAITHEAQGRPLGGQVRAVDRLRADNAFLLRVQKHMHPGTTMILTEAPLHPDTRSAKDFVIMS
ncbi:MAG: L,D-transpeptidase [Mesorhizobium sp.]|nr:L,D-transpeptidase [Mesorhizobium sp.]